jgi:serine/threonine protein kinase
MANVYRASDEELGVDVAIKLLKPGMATGDMRARMVQEAQAAAQVRHANLVRVFGTGKLDDTAYIAMELLDGPNLETYLRERPGERLPWRAALDLLLPALEALHAVHERGYVHRDIKPGNILVAREPGCSPRAVVIDLGLVKPDRALRCVAGPPSTEVGRVLCTPGYASPEQVRECPVDRRSDVYSMAITLYRVLAGRLPFHGARGKPNYVVFAHHVHQDPTLLADAAVDADIPPAIAKVIESGLAKDPADRPQTMLAFADALQAAAIASSPPSRSPFHRWPYGLVVAQILVLLSAWRLAPDSGVHRANRTAPPIHHPIAAKNENESSAPAVTPSALPDPAPSPPPGPPAVPRIDPAAAARRELARRVHAVQVCFDETSSTRGRLAVAVSIDTTGRVSAHLQDAADSPLSRCLAQALQHRTPTPPSRPLSFVHIYALRATAQRP